MKVGLAQFNPTIGDLDGNLKKILQQVESAKQQQIDLLVFPELSLSGYPPRDLLFEDGFVERQVALLERVRNAATDLAICCGFVAPNPAPTGRPFYNAVAVFENGRQQAIYRKRLLPYYDIFDEPRYFEAGDTSCVVKVAGKNIGLAICEDIWNQKGFLDRPYSIDPVNDYSAKGLDLLVVLSASPFHLGKPAVRERLVQVVSKRVGAPVLFCNQVGANDELIFDGSSLVAHGDQLLIRAPSFQEALSIVDISSPSATTVTAMQESPFSWVCEALQFGIREYVEKCRGTQVIVGVSGGIDSAVVAALAAKALGPKAVLGVSLPTRFTSSGSQGDARQLCENLKIPFQEISIEPLLSQFVEQWKHWFTDELKGIALENLQPRLRMTLLMAMANERGAMLLNTSNKSEIATGYATLYGDSAGALSVIGDLTKKQVYGLAEFLNAEAEHIPRSILDRAPSAELREDQTDSQSLPPYDQLDALVEARVRSWGERLAEGTPEGLLFDRLYSNSEFKRAQLPPVLRVSEKAFGTGRRFPIAKR